MTVPREFKMASVVDDLFVVGDDFEAILDVLEQDEELEEEFDVAVTDVESTDITCSDCGKKCKSKGGYKRHRNAKHKDTSSSIPTKDQIFTASDLNKIVQDVIGHINKKDVFPPYICNELNHWDNKELEESSEEFILIKSVYEEYFRNGNGEKFYMNFYGKICLNGSKFFTGLSRNAATLLATKVADSMMTYCNKLKSTQDHSGAPNTEISEQEIAGLQYLGGYVLQNLYKKFTRKQSPESEQAASILKAGKMEERSTQEEQKLISCLNRGGLWCITKAAQAIFTCTEQYFRQLACSSSKSIDVKMITEKAMNDTRAIANYQCLIEDCEVTTTSTVKKDVFCSLITLYVNVRSYSFARDIIERHKILSKTNKGKALRKEIMRSCDKDELERSV